MANENNKGILKYVLIGIALLVVGYLIYTFVIKKDNTVIQKPITPPRYKTEEVIEAREYPDPDSLHTNPGKKVNPITVIKWLPSKPTAVDSMAIINNYIALYLKGKDTPTQDVNINFITQYPNAVKLLTMDILKDSLQITTFNKEAEVKTEIYPLYLDSYNYHYVGTTLSSTEVGEKRVPRERLIWNKFYGNVGYDTYNKSALLGLEWNLTPGRVKFDVNADVLLRSENRVNINAKVGYRLFK